MSTRASIVFKDEFGMLFFYRHSDGYPECCGKDLEGFVKGYSKTMRANATQSAGHLILRGHEEYKKDGTYDWKVGAYEPTDSIQCDVEYVYLIDLTKGIIETRVPKDGFFDRPTLSKTKVISKLKFIIEGRI